MYCLCAEKQNCLWRLVCFNCTQEENMFSACNLSNVGDFKVGTISYITYHDELMTFFSVDCFLPIVMNKIDSCK